MQNAYTFGSTQVNPNGIELGHGILDNLSLQPGLLVLNFIILSLFILSLIFFILKRYTWTTAVVLGVGKSITLNGACGDVIIMQST